MNRKITKQLFVLTIVFMLSIFVLNAFSFADDSNIEIIGTVNSYAKDGSEWLKSYPSNEGTTAGSLSISGNISDILSKDDLISYVVDDGTLSITYSYDDTLKNVPITSWHLGNYNSKKFSSLTLKNKAKSGAIVVQTSHDREKWTTVSEECDVFEVKPTNSDANYVAKDLELQNGCYYRVIVAYKLEARTKDRLLKDKFIYKTIEEVYEFYALSSDSFASPQNNDIQTQTFNLGTVVRTENASGYVIEDIMDKDDPHYNITLGQFYVSGFTKKEEKDGNIVFLKNAGDKVTLSFRLYEDIDAIGGNNKIKVTSDENGYDSYFQTKPTNVGRGMMIIRYTDYHNDQHEPEIYTNFLEANASKTADTVVGLFEEGDYEVALDYQLTEDRLLDKTCQYCIFFTFSIRNGNSMVFPIDIETENELTNTEFAENGFYLDFARSRYLNIDVKCETLSQNGMELDTRFNRPAKDGDKYTNEGIYTITATSEYAQTPTIKRICVGNNDILRAHIITEKPIREIVELINNGAIIDANGNIVIPESATTDVSQPVENPSIDSSEVQPIEDISDNFPEERLPMEKQDKTTTIMIILIIIGIAVVAVGLVAILNIKKLKTQYIVRVDTSKLNKDIPEEIE